MAILACTVEGCNSPRRGQGLCNKHHIRMKAHGTTELPPKPTLEQRLWAKVDVRGPDECWLWKAEFCLTAAGYGRIGVADALPGPVIWDAHRVVYWLTHGPIPNDLHVDHLCHSRVSDVECPPGVCPHRRCCNPAHLEAVDWHENTVVRREARKTRFKCGHPFEGNRVRNGGVGRCAECHREKERIARAEGRRSA